MTKRVKSITAFFSLACVIVAAGCKAVPQELLPTNSPINTMSAQPSTATAVVSATPCTYQVVPPGEQPEPAKLNKEVPPLVPIQTEQIQQELAVKDKTIAIDATASIPLVATLPVLQAEYIPSLEKQAMEKIATNTFINPAKAHYLTDEEIKAKSYNPNDFRFVVGDSKFVLSASRMNKVMFTALGLPSSGEPLAQDIDQAATILQDKLSHIYQEVDVWPEPVIIENDQITFMQCIWGMPVAYNNTYVNGSIPSGSAALQGWVTLRDETQPATALWREVNHVKGQVYSYSITEPLRVTGIKKEHAEIIPLHDLLNNLTKKTIASALLQPKEFTKISFIRMVYVPESDGVGMILKPYWELGGNEDSDQALCLYRYSALAEDYQK